VTSLEFHTSYQPDQGGDEVFSAVRRLSSINTQIKANSMSGGGILMYYRRHDKEQSYRE